MQLVLIRLSSWDKWYIYLYPLVFVVKRVLKFNGICSYIFHSSHLACTAKGVQLTKVNRLSSESPLYKNRNYSFIKVLVILYQ